MQVPPLLHEGLEFRVVPVRQHDAGGDEQVASRAGRLGQPLALEAKNPAAGSVFWYRKFDRAAERRYANLAAEHGFVKRDRQIETQVTALNLEVRMRGDIDRDQEIAGPVTGRGLSLPLQPDLLTGIDARGNLDVEFFAGRQPDALLDALYRLFQRHRHGDAEIEIERDAARIELERSAAAAGPCAARRSTAEHAVEDILERAAAQAPGPRASGAECVCLKSAGTAARTRVTSRKALEARLALSVDLATIELFALLLVAEDLVGRVQLGKARGRFRIILVGVGVVFLRKLAVGAFDRRSAGAPRHPQHLIGVAHSSDLLQGILILS